MAQYAENKPTADVLMSSMRSMGYTFEAAVADIIDNSISAEANSVQIYFPVDPAELFIAICDNGYGMDRAELFDAMKYGSSLKRGKRSESDLGRFGLGLKSASLLKSLKCKIITRFEQRVRSPIKRATPTSLICLILHQEYASSRN